MVLLGQPSDELVHLQLAVLAVQAMAGYDTSKSKLLKTVWSRFWFADLSASLLNCDRVFGFDPDFVAP